MPVLMRCRESATRGAPESPTQGVRLRCGKSSPSQRDSPGASQLLPKPRLVRIRGKLPSWSRLSPHRDKDSWLASRCCYLPHHPHCSSEPGRQFDRHIHSSHVLNWHVFIHTWSRLASTTTCMTTTQGPHAISAALLSFGGTPTLHIPDGSPSSPWRLGLDGPASLRHWTLLHSDVITLCYAIGCRPSPVNL